MNKSKTEKMTKQKYWIEDYPIKCKDQFHETLLNEVGFETYLYYKLYNIDQENLNNDCVKSFIKFFNQFLEIAQSSESINSLIVCLYNNLVPSEPKKEPRVSMMSLSSVRPVYENEYSWGLK